MWRAGQVRSVTYARLNRYSLGFSLLALAQGAKKYKYSRPRMTHENVIDIKAGRYGIA